MQKPVEAAIQEPVEAAVEELTAVPPAAPTEDPTAVSPATPTSASPPDLEKQRSVLVETPPEAPACSEEKEPSVSDLLKNVISHGLQQNTRQLADLCMQLSFNFKRHNPFHLET